MLVSIFLGILTLINIILLILQHFMEKRIENSINTSRKLLELIDNKLAIYEDNQQP